MAHHHLGARTVETLGSLLMSLPLLFLSSHTSNLCFYVPSSVFSAQSLYFFNLTSNLPGHHPFFILLLYSALSSMIRPPYSLLSFLLSFFLLPFASLSTSSSFVVSASFRWCLSVESPF